MRRIHTYAIVATWIAVMALAAPALAVTNGTLDGDDHPYVGLMVLYGDPLEGEELQELADDLGVDVNDVDPRFSNPLHRCSGTLVSPTHYLTAGHCVTQGENLEDGSPNEGSAAVVWFHSDIQSQLDAVGYPFQPVLSDPLIVAGDPEAHPQYNDAAFYLFDLGIVLLEESVMGLGFGELPELGVVDTLPRGRKALAIEAVGYGLQKASANPVHASKTQADRVRYQADLQIIDDKGTAGVPAGTSFTTSGDKNTGGTCFGDSGGPNFVNGTNIVAGVTSFGLNLNCGGVGGVYRVDAVDDLDWLSAEFGL
ncbi:MAG TPA: trypsin-like serine protease [Nitriliruptorales bacterium]